MSEAKDKDRILAQLQAHTSHTEIARLDKYADELIADGYASASRDERGRFITVSITLQGKRFLDNGGYAAARKHKVRAIALKAVKWFLAALILAAIGAIANTMLPPLLSK